MVHATPPKTPKISLINFKHNQTNMSIDVNKLFSPVKIQKISVAEQFPYTYGIRILS